MKIPAIRTLVETYSLDELQAAEEALANEASPAITVDGQDEGEQLTHVFAAIFIKEEMQGGSDFKTALREYTRKVRESIS